MALGEQAAQAQFFQFSRAQEATADQMGQKFLRVTHQSGQGMLEVFSKFANEEAEITYGRNDPLISDHPLSRERIGLLQQLVDSSPYKDVKDSPETVHEFHLIQAKLAGFLDKVDTTLQRYPVSDTSEEAHYARAIAYFRQPDMKNALAEADTLVKINAKNPYFWEVLGQIYVDMAQPQNGILPYQKSVDLAPNEPLLRLSLAAAEIATGKPQFAKPALDNLKVVLRQENNNTFAWYEAAQAYSDTGNEPMANLSTAELDYNIGNFPAAAHFATLAQHRLAAGSPDWQRAMDILAVSGSNSDRCDDRVTRRHWMKSAWSVAVAGALGGAVLSVAAIFAAAQPGLLPTPDSRMHDYLLSHPQVLVEMTNRLQAKQDASDEAVRQGAVQQARTEAVLRSQRGFRHRAGKRADHVGGVLRLQLSLLPRLRAGHEEVLRGAQEGCALRLHRIPDQGTAIDRCVARRYGCAQTAGQIPRVPFLVDGPERSRSTEDTVYADAAEGRPRRRQAEDRHEGPLGRLRARRRAHPRQRGEYRRHARFHHQRAHPRRRDGRRDLATDAERLRLTPSSQISPASGLDGSA